MMQVYKKIKYLSPLLILITAMCISGCVVHRNGDFDASGSTSSSNRMPALAEMGYVNINSLPDGNGAINPIRLQALRETATTLGARGALAWRSEHIDEALTEESSNLDHVFDFNQLLLKHNVLPPVIAESSGNLNV